MTEERAKRKLSGILNADAVGYSRLMQEDEASTIRTLGGSKRLMSELIEQFKGRVVDAPGDNLLAEFGSVVDATECAVKIQQELKTKNAELPDNRKMDFRIGVNLGDVVEEADRIYGDGVNIAARIEGLAEPGGICISRTAFDHVKNKLKIGYEYLGEHSVKNISEPVRVYRILLEPESAGKVIGEKKPNTMKWRWAASGAIALTILAVGIFAIWNYYFRPSFEPASVEKMAFPLPEKPSIAVLPFDNMSGDPDQEYFSDGITEQIISSLSKIPKLFVVARNSTFTYKGRPVKISKVAEEFGVRYVMEGSVQKSGNRIRIIAQLIDALTGHHIWAERYERDFKEIFALQDEITTEILKAVQVEITEGHQTFYWAKWGTDNLKSFEKNLQGIAAMVQLTKQNNIYARELFEEAIDLDPEYIWPYVNLGWTHFWDVYYRWSRSPKISLGKAFELAQKALAIDDRIDLAHSLLGSLYYMNRKYEEAIAEAERAVSLNPNGASAYMILASMVSQSGRWDDGIAFGLKAIRLNPVPDLGIFVMLGRAHFMTGQYEESITWCKKALNINPNFLPARAFLAACYSSLGLQTEAAAEAEEIVRTNSKFNLDSYVKTLHYKNKSDVDRYIAALRKTGLPEHPPLQLPDKPSIAVLAFDNLSGDPEQEYFSDGIAENIITALSKVGELFVIARNSSFTYKGKPVKIQQVSQELGVRYALEGSVRRSGDWVRITAQLIDAKNGQHLWAENYDREFKDIFEIQDEITMKIVTAMRIKLTEGEQGRVFAKQTKNLDVYLKQIEANSLWNKGTKEGLIRFGQLAQEIIDAEPESSLGYKLRAYYYKGLADLGMSPPENLKKAFTFAQKALALGEFDALTHAALGYIYVKGRKYEKAIASGKRSVELDPNNALAHCLYGSTLAYTERFDEGIVYIKQAIRLNPFPPYYYYYHLGRCYYGKGQYEDALAELKKALQRAPDAGVLHFVLAITYSLLDREEEARASAVKAVELFPFLSVTFVSKTWPYKTQDRLKITIDAMRKAGIPE